MAFDADFNINPTTTSLVQTQATSGVTQQASGYLDFDQPVAATNTGAILDLEDSGSPTRSNTQVSVNNASNVARQLIEAKPNILDRFSSYTYRASVYLLSPQQYKLMIATNKKNVNGYNLLFQSGGAPNNTGGFQGALNQGPTYYENDGTVSTNTVIPGGDQPSAGRNPAFDVDFYIDNIEITTLTPGRSTMSSHSAATLKFTVVEPNGISLIDRIYQAVQDSAPLGAGGAVNYGAAAYLMVLRFYGYDENGNLVTGIGAPSQSTPNTDPNAIVEKFIPFRIAKINWGVSNKLVTYEFEGVPYAQLALGTRRGTVPYDVQLSEITVEQMLGGELTYTTTSEGALPAQGTTTAAGPVGPPERPPANDTEARLRANAAQLPQNRNRLIGGNQTVAETQRLQNQNAAPGPTKSPSKANSATSAKKSIKQGLMQAVNDFQKELCFGPDAKYQTPDEYRIVFASGAEDIANATLVLPGKKKEDAQTPMAAPLSQQPSNINQTKISKDPTSRNQAITAGMQIVQAIELVIRNSSYITNQMTTQIDAYSDDEIVKSSNDKPVDWFLITPIAEPIEPYDTLRNDYAMRITFVISKYQLQNYESKYFAPAKFKGVVKSYPYWFTGQNSAVLDYQEQLNTLYNITVSGSNPTNSLAEQTRRKILAAQRDQPFFQYQSASAESRQGSEGRGNEASSSIADSLYNPGDLANCKLKIVGDPAWFQQGSLAGGIFPGNFNYSPFNPDGTINFDSQQVMFEVAWTRPYDYDPNTGIINPQSAVGRKVQTIQSRVYQCRKVTHEFKQGQFTQSIDGTLFLYLKPNLTDKAATAPAPNSVSTQFDTSSVLGDSDTSRLSTLPTTTAAATGLKLPGSLSSPIDSTSRLTNLTAGALITTGISVGARGLGLGSQTNINKLLSPPPFTGAQTPSQSVVSSIPGTNLFFPPAPKPPTTGFGGGQVSVGVSDAPSSTTGSTDASLLGGINLSTAAKLALAAGVNVNTSTLQATNLLQKMNRET